MEPQSVRCFLVERDEQGKVHHRVTSVPGRSLPPGEVLIRVNYSSVNYKDALATEGHPGIVRQFPHVPGVDAAGHVEASSDPRFSPGQPVLVQGHDLGAGHWGGWAEWIRVPANWVMPWPEPLTMRQGMAIGIAGFTAGLCVAALIDHGVEPGCGEVVVTGATGGVGSFAVMLLAQLGYRVVAATGKPSWHERLRRWGAAAVVSREDMVQQPDKPLLSGRWAGGVDTVGGATLGTILRATRHSGCVTACGLVGGADLPITVYPFILRGIHLAGIDAAWCSMEQRQAIWSKLATSWMPKFLDDVIVEMPLEDLAPLVRQMLQGQFAGRIVVPLSVTP